MFRMVVDFQHDGRLPFTRALPTPDTIEVVGNIHENSELLSLRPARVWKVLEHELSRGESLTEDWVRMTSLARHPVAHAPTPTPGDHHGREGA